jgi:serine/threonine protein kinase
VDFGLARGGEADAQFTQAGAVIGTPAYMAPEQASGEPVDARCDLFSLGSVLYRAATGASAFAGRDTLAILSALATRTPTPPHRLVPSLPRMFSGLVMRLLAKDPADRPQSAQEVVDAIEALVESGETATEAEAYAPEETAPPPASVAEREGRKSNQGPRKRPRVRRKTKRSQAERDWGLWVVVAGAALLVVGALALLLVLIRPAG